MFRWIEYSRPCYHWSSDPAQQDQLAEKDILHVSRFPLTAFAYPEKRSTARQPHWEVQRWTQVFIDLFVDWTKTELLQKSTTQPRFGSFPKEARPRRYQTSAQPAPSLQQKVSKNSYSYFISVPLLFTMWTSVKSRAWYQLLSLNRNERIKKTKKSNCKM